MLRVLSRGEPLPLQNHTFREKPGIDIAWRGGDVVRPWGGQWFGPQWPSGQVRFRCPWRVLPFIRWNLFGRKGYAGFKAFGVDREEYVQYMGAALVSVGSVALCPSFRLAAEDH